jgi:uncharacterized protein (TIGR02996 family)
MSADALLKSVLASPEDDLPRLVYADWLDEHGDPARAEFIRTQIELATLPDHDPRYRALEDREHELLSEHEAGWMGDATMREWDWRRGFIDSAAGTREQLSFLDALCHQGHPISQVRCTGVIGFDQFALTNWSVNDWPSRVTSLDFGGCHFDHDQMAMFLARTVMPKLRSIDLTSTPSERDLCDLFWNSPLRRQLTAISAGPRDHTDFNATWLLEAFAEARMEKLSLHSCGITNDDLSSLMPENWSGTLKHLDISDNPIAPDAYLAFQQCHPNMRLDKLDVSGTPLAGISLEPLLNAASLQSLTKLEMNGCGSARRNMEVLSRSAFWNQATELRAHSGTIPASTLEPLWQSAGPPGLRLLDLADNYLRTEGVRMLCEAPWAGSLTWLALSRNYLDDESCEVLAKSGRFTNLRTLHLAHNHFTQDGADGEQITSRGVMALAEAPSLANLRLLTLSYTGITDAAVDVVVNAPFWRLFGLGIGGCNLSPTAVRTLANSPRLRRFTWLDVSHNRRLGGQTLRPLAESPYLSRMCELDCGGIDIADDVRAIFRERLGPRFSH